MDTGTVKSAITNIVMEEPLLSRYKKQMRLKKIGVQGQQRIQASSVAVIGCGALGSVIADSMVRSGVGRVVLVDRDYIELDNLQRQVLFDEDDIARDLPKAVAAARKLEKVNSQVKIEPVFSDVTPRNIEAIIQGVDLVLDGTDNFETRFLINDACVKLDVPWIYGGVMATYGMCFTIIPGKTPCFRCLISDAPAQGTVATCETEGVLVTAVHIVASIEVTEAIKILTGNSEELLHRLYSIDVWSGEHQSVKVGKEQGGRCPCCDERRFEFLDARTSDRIITLCGRNAVQVTPHEAAVTNLKSLAERLGSIGEVSGNEYMLRFRIPSYEFTILKDGRTIIKGTSDTAFARTLYSRYVGA